MKNKMTPTEVLESAKKQGVNLFVHNGKLAIKKDKNIKLSKEFLNIIQKNKEELLLFFKEVKFYEEKITKIELSNQYEISNAQRRVLFSSQLKERSIAYNVPNSITFDNTLDIINFKKAIYAVIERHEILRTTFFIDEEGKPWQRILTLNELNFSIKEIDYTKEDLPLKKANEYIDFDSKKSFDLNKGPLLRICLLKISNDRCIFYSNMHHIISDEWSMEVLSKDILIYYDAFKMNKVPLLNELSIQYKDYASWQLSQLETESSKQSKDFWINSLSGKLPTLDLPTSKNRPPVKTYNGSSLSTYLDKDITSFIKKYSQINGGTLFTGLLTVLNVLLYKYTSEKDIIIGLPVAARDHIDLKDQIGFYVNTLALRNEIDPKEKFSSFYSRLREKTLAAYKHQTYPFDRLIEDLNVDNDTSRSALFDIMLVLQNNGGNTLEVDLDQDKLDSVIYTEKVASKFDLEFVFNDNGVYLSLNVIYNSDVYEKEIISQFMQHFKQLLETLHTNPDIVINKIDYLSKEEKHELLEEFNATEASYPKDKTILDLFSEQVENNPDNVAVVYEDVEITYKELDEKSNQLAQYLIYYYAIEKEDLVGIKLDRSEWMIISILGILKSGGAYVPIDPSYPRDRITYIEEDINCKVCIDEEELELFMSLNYPSQSIELSLSSANLAYVMYTSGSTGKPKGVEIEQKSIIRLVKNGLYYDFTSKDVVLSTGSPSFDAVTMEYWGPLLNGGKLILVNNQGIIESNKLKDLISNFNVNLMWFTSGLLNRLIEDDIEIFKGLSTVICGGEKLSYKHIFRLKSECFDLKLINGYGPTENTTFSTYYNIEDVQNLNYNIPIGSPIGNSTSYILDENLKEVPVGVSGEILVGGIGLARGYFKRPDLTKEKFIEHPFIKGERLYRTGDVGKWLPGGIIEFIGRKDNQVKIRGYRIELGEIENALSQLSKIESNIVIVREKKDGYKQLIAYVISQDDLNVEFIRQDLKDVLPDYMLPSHFIQIDEFPITLNGKVDKKNLPSPEEYGTSVNTEYVAPETEAEKILTSVIEIALNIKDVGVNDNFYSLGGDSISFIKVISGLKKHNYNLGIAESIENPVLKNMAKKMELDIKISKEIELEKIKESKQLLESNISYNQDYFFNKPNELLISFTYTVSNSSKETLIELLKNYFGKYESLRTVFKKDQKEVVTQHKVNTINLGIHSINNKDFISRQEVEELGLNYLREKYNYFNEEPLVRVFIVEDSKNKNLHFKYSIAHALIDITTLHNIEKNLENFMNKKLVRNEDISNFNFAVAQKKYLNSYKGVIDRVWWKEYLNPVIQNKEIHFKNELSDYIVESLLIKDDEYKELKELSKSFNVPLSVLVLTFFQILLNKNTEEGKQFIQVAMDGREMEYEGINISKIDGLTTNFLPYKINSLNVPFEEGLREVFEQYLTARLHQRVPYSLIQKDFKMSYNIDIEALTKGYFNFRINDRDREFKEEKQFTDTLYKSGLFEYGLVCDQYNNAINLRLLSLKENSTRESISSLKNLINQSIVMFQ